MMSDDDKYVEIKERISTLIDTFFKEETTSQERKQILEEVERFPGHLKGALFGIIGWNYEFEIDGKAYTLQYDSKYYLDTFTSEYVLNLYDGREEDKELIKQECDKDKGAVFTRFMKLVDSIKEGKFEIDHY